MKWLEEGYKREGEVKHIVSLPFRCDCPNTEFLIGNDNKNSVAIRLNCLQGLTRFLTVFKEHSTGGVPPGLNKRRKHHAYDLWTMAKVGNPSKYLCVSCNLSNKVALRLPEMLSPLV